jgi:hypothetical protein
MALTPFRPSRLGERNFAPHDFLRQAQEGEGVTWERPIRFAFGGSNGPFQGRPIVEARQSPQSAWRGPLRGPDAASTRCEASPAFPPVAVSSKRRVMAVARPAMLKGDVFAEAPMADVHMDEAASLGNESAHGRVGAQGHHGGALGGAHRPEIDRHSAVVIRTTRVAAVASGSNFQSSDTARKTMKDSPDL